MTIETRQPADPGWATPARAEAVAHQAKKPKPAITRNRWHQYTYQGVTYPGLTTVLRVINKDALIRWASRLTAEAAVSQAADLPGLVERNGVKGVVDMLLNQSDKRRDEAGSRGTEVHELAEKMLKGEPLPPLSEEKRAMLQGIAEWWARSGWRMRMTEALVVNPSMGYGGTLDLLAYDADGLTVLADYKTSSGGIYGETRLQLLGYGEATYIAPQGSPVVYNMPRIDRYVGLHVTTDGVTEVPMDIDDLDRQALHAVLPLHRWHQERKGKVPVRKI